MSTAITTVYANALTRIDAVLTSGAGWNKLTNAYDILQNDSTFLKQGYALAIGPGRNTKRVQSSTLSIQRDLILSITRADDSLSRDIAGKQTIEKTLLEDLRSVIADLEENQTLNSGEIFCEFVSDGGIEFVNDGEIAFYLIKGIFSVEYFEEL